MERLIVYTNPTSLQAEAYRTLCNSVLAIQEGKKIFEFASVSEDANESLMVANLAVAIAQTGKKVLLMDCNLRKPKQHELFALPNNGLSECIMLDANLKEVIQVTMQANLSVLTAGTTVSNPVEMLTSINMQSILTEVKETYEVVLLDVTPVDKISDAVVLGAKTDGIILGFIKNKDKIEQIQKVKDLFKQARLNILGCILIE